MLQMQFTDRLSNTNFSALLQARSWSQLREQMQHALTLLNISDFMLKMDVTPPNRVAQCHLFGTLPASLANLFHTNALNDADPINNHAARSGLPLTWQVEALCAQNSGQVYPQLKAHGIAHGVSMIVRSEHARSRVDFYTKASASLLPLTALCADLFLLGSYLHEATDVLWHAETTEQEPLLSGREIECLHWSARGKTSREIGLILGISQNTVSFHLKNAASKFDVYGTRHAVSRAIETGLVKPGR